MRKHKKWVLPLLLLATVVGVAAAANAGPGPRKPRDAGAVWDDIKSGRAPKVATPPGREVSWAGVWNGCRFVFLRSHISSYQTSDGIAEVAERPDALPPKGPDCVDREPTPEEIDAMRVEVTARNAGGRPDGAPAPPELPPAQARTPR